MITTTKVKQKFVIVTHRSAGGGTLVMHNLCRLLNELGQDAKVIYFANGNYDNQNHAKFWINWCIYQIRISIKYIAESVLGPEKLKGYFDSPFRKTRRKYFPFVNNKSIVGAL